MPQLTASLPGIRGKDYRFVVYGGRVYVVYTVKLPNGRRVLMSWRVDKGDYKAFGIEPGKLQKISKNQFQNLNFFGDVSEITGGEPGEHPFQKYLRKLRELHGNVSWLSDREFMSVMLMGFVEQWSDAELRQRLSRTRWYQSRTNAQRTWELELSKAEKRNAINTWSERMVDALEELYGPAFSLQEAGIDSTDLKKSAEAIASGKWGDPTEGFEIWLGQERDKAEKVEGSAAWISLQTELEEQRAFMNRPEDMFEQLRQDAMMWLGPAAVPSTEILQSWSERLVSGVASEADWQQWIQQQAQSLYPFLGPNETWQDRASAYKRIVEETWGMPITWDDPILGRIGEGGEALSYDEFTKLARQDDRFWQGPVAREEGFDLFNYLNQVFQGVGV